MTSQRNASQVVSEEQCDSLASDTLRYLLGMAHTKFPIKRQDIIKNVLKDYSKNFKAIMERARKFLNEDYGIDVVEVSTSATNKSYILISQFRYKDIPNVREFIPQPDKCQQILLMVVLSFIFMKGGTVKEEMLWEFLLKLGLIRKESSFTHELFGEVHKTVSQDFVRQLYLEYRIIPLTDPPRREFVLGKRTELEVSYRGLLEFMVAVYGSASVQMWNTQYQAVLQQEHSRRKQSPVGYDSSISSQPPSQSEASVLVSQKEPSASLQSKNSSSQPGPLKNRDLQAHYRPGPSGLQMNDRIGSSNLQSRDRPGSSGLVTRGAGSSNSHSSGAILHPSNLSQTRQRVKSSTQEPSKKRKGS